MCWPSRRSIRTGSRAAKVWAISFATAIIRSGDQTDPKTFLFPRGIVMGRDITKVLPVDPSKITESVATPGTSIRAAMPRHPSFGGRNQSEIQRAEAAYDHLDVDAKYSWLKTPRYDGKPMEVGPLARMVVGYASGKKEIKARSTARSKH